MVLTSTEHNGSGSVPHGCRYYSSTVAGVAGLGTMKVSVASAIIAFICIYIAGFAWSWGPLGWLVPSEIQPL